MAALSWSAVATTSMTLLILVGLSLLGTLSFSYESAIVLQPGSPMIATLAPYEIYEILVPTDTLNEHQQYQIVASWNGGQSQDIIIKRKQQDFDAYADSLYDGSDFKQRKEISFAKKKLKDNRPSSQFEVNEEGRYINDPEEMLFEIYQGEDNRRYLVFLLSIFKISMAYDEELMMREMEIGLSITPEQGKLSYLTNGQFQILAILATVFVIIAFFATLYFFVLPSHIKDRVFGLSNADACKTV